MSEIHMIDFLGHRLRVVLDHNTALAEICASGFDPPAMPPGCNTVSKFIRLSDGRAALAINQRGFARIVQDALQEVNGCGLVSLVEPGNKMPHEAQQKILEAFFETLSVR